MKQFSLLFFVFITWNCHSQNIEVIFGDSMQNCSAKTIVYAGNSLSVLVNCTDTTGSNNGYIYKFDTSGQYISQYYIPVSNMVTERMMIYNSNLLVCGSVFDSTGDAQAIIFAVDTGYSISWERRFGPQGSDDSFKGICTLPDGSIVASGYTENTSGAGNASYAVKTDSAGNFSWEQIYSTSFNSYSDAIVSLNDGTMILSGDRASAAGPYTNATVRIDSSGSIVWELENPNPYNNGCKNDILTSDRNILVVGESATATNSVFDPMISKVDTSGNERWSYIYAGAPGSTDALLDICEIHSDRFIAAGFGGNPITASLDILLMEIDSAGNENYRTYIGDTSGIDLANDLLTEASGQGIYICGSTFRNNKTRATIIYRSLSSLQSIETNFPSRNFYVYPNPSRGQLLIPEEYNGSCITVYDMQGQTVFVDTLLDGSIDLLHLKNGLYILKVIHNNYTATSRVSIIH